MTLLLKYLSVLKLFCIFLRIQNDSFLMQLVLTQVTLRDYELDGVNNRTVKKKLIVKRLEFEMKNKLATLALGAVLSSGLFVGAASAVTVVPGPLYTLDNLGTAPDGFYKALLDTLFTQAANTVTATYHFIAAVGFPDVDVDIIVSGQTGAITFATWKDTSVILASVLNNVTTNTKTLIAGHTYDLFLSVSKVATAKKTFAESGFTIVPSPVPVPPAAILLLSGLVGIGALGRKRSGKVSV